ncbi:MAG TPA: hypothetical protein VD860_01860 [Azospirillum sp.]|nr:hypothetical protein [Azospirillum sp.]
MGEMDRPITFRHLHVLERVRDCRNPRAFVGTLGELSRRGLIAYDWTGYESIPRLTKAGAALIAQAADRQATQPA